MHPIAALAKETVETYIRTGKRPSPPADLIPEMKEKAGVFVSIHKKGELRGSIGTFEPRERNGLLLADLEGVDTADYQIDICRQKGGIGPEEPVKLYRFEVKRHK